VLSELKLSAIAVAFIVAFVVPYGSFYIAPVVLSLATGERSGDVPLLLVVSWFLCSVLSPVLAGYLAARLARVQPLLHGAITASLAALLGALLVDSTRSALITFLVFVPCGILGAWIWRRSANAAIAP
jgi:MFS family permease